MLAAGSPGRSSKSARVTMAPPGAAKLSGDWEVLPPAAKGRYLHGTINARQPGDSRPADLPPALFFSRLFCAMIAESDETNQVPI